MLGFYLRNVMKIRKYNPTEISKLNSDKKKMCINTQKKPSATRDMSIVSSAKTRHLLSCDKIALIRKFPNDHGVRQEKVLAVIQNYICAHWLLKSRNNLHAFQKFCVMRSSHTH